MTVPDWTKYWRVDEAIECLTLGDMREQVTKELLDAMPDAYIGCGHNDPEMPGFHEYPLEPDHPCRTRFAVAKVWDHLSEPVRAALDAAHQKEMR